MSDHIYKKVEIVGTSTVSIEDAVENAVRRAASSIHHLRWLEVIETRAKIEGDKIDHWQVTVKIGFTVEE